METKLSLLSTVKVYGSACWRYASFVHNWASIMYSMTVIDADVVDCEVSRLGGSLDSVVWSLDYVARLTVSVRNIESASHFSVTVRELRMVYDIFGRTYIMTSSAMKEYVGSSKKVLLANTVPTSVRF